MLIALGLVGWLHIGREKRKWERQACVRNLKELGKAYQGWLHDFGDQLPWRISQEKGGSNGKAKASEHYQILSNHLTAIKVLACPTLFSTRSPAKTMQELKDENVSYVVGVDARVLPPETGHMGSYPILAADLDITSPRDVPRSKGVCGMAGNIEVDKFEGKYGQEETYRASWGPLGHPNYGQLLLGDGSVVSVEDTGLRRMLSLSQDAGDESHILKPSK